MRPLYFLSIPFVLVLALALFAGPTAVSAKNIQMLPPLTRTGAGCPETGSSNTQMLLTWNGSDPLKCVQGIRVEGFSTNAAGNLIVDNNLTVAKTTTATGGLILPKVAPASPVAGQIWLVP